MCKPNPLPLFYFFSLSVVISRCGLLLISLFLWSEACLPGPPCFPRDVTKREVSSLFSMVAAWLRCCGLTDQNNSSSPLFPPLVRRGPWTGEWRDTGAKLGRRPAAVFCLPSVPPCVSLVTEPHLREPLASSPLLAFVVVYLFTEASSAIEASRTVNALANCPLRTTPRVARVLWCICLILFGRKCRERRVTIHLRDFAQWNPAITRKHTHNGGVYRRWLSSDNVEKRLHGFYTQKTLHVLVQRHK